MKRMLDGIQKPKSTLRMWRFRKKVPDCTFLFVAPSPMVFSVKTKVIAFVATLLLGPALAFSVSTNAAFSDADDIRASGIGTGEWVPDIRFEEKNGCVKLESSLSNAVIYYKFSDDGDPRINGEIFDGSCIDIPKRETFSLEAQAFHPENDAWRSEVIMQTISGERLRNKEWDKNRRNHQKRGEGNEKRDRDATSDADSEGDSVATCDEEVMNQHGAFPVGEDDAVTLDERSPEGNLLDNIPDDEKEAYGIETSSSPLDLGDTPYGSGIEILEALDNMDHSLAE